MPLAYFNNNFHPTRYTTLRSAGTYQEVGSLLFWSGHCLPACLLPPSYTYRILRRDGWLGKFHNKNVLSNIFVSCPFLFHLIIAERLLLLLTLSSFWGRNAPVVTSSTLELSCMCLWTTFFGERKIHNEPLRNLPSRFIPIPPVVVASFRRTMTFPAFLHSFTYRPQFSGLFVISLGWLNRIHIDTSYYIYLCPQMVVNRVHVLRAKKKFSNEEEGR